MGDRLAQRVPRPVDGAPDYDRRDFVMIRWVSHGTYKGDSLGVPASGKVVSLPGFDLFRIADGKIAELWQDYETLKFMQQVGALPPPGRAF